MPEIQGIPVRDSETGEMTFLDLHNNVRVMRDSSGRLVKMDLGQADVHIDSALANVAFGYKLASGVADVAAPVIPTTKASDKYWIWDVDDALQPAANALAAPGGAVHELSPRLSSSTFSTSAFALQAFVSTELEGNADTPLRPRVNATRRLMNALMIAREKRVAAMLRNAANYPAAFQATIAAGAKWNGGASSTPVADLYNRIEAALMPITDVVMSEQVYHDFVQNAAVQKFTASKMTTPGANPIPKQEQASQYAALLGLPPIQIAAMKAKDSAGNYTYVYGGDVILLHSPGMPVSDGQDISTAYTYRWSLGAAGSGDGVSGDTEGMKGGWFVRSYFDPKRGPRGGTVIVVGHNDAEVFTSGLVSGLIISAHQ